MQQIPYESSAHELRIDAPVEWDLSSLSAVDLSAYDNAGAALFEDEACTLYTATTLDAAISQFDDTFVLVADSDAPVRGDSLRIVGTTGVRTIVVDGYDASTRTVKCEQVITLAFDAGAAVYGNKITVEIDFSDTAVFKAGLVFTLAWAPTGTGITIEDRVQISTFATDIPTLEKRFGRLYPRASIAFKEPIDRFAEMVNEAEIQLGYEMRTANMDYNHVVGEPILAQILMSKMACMWVLNADDDLDDERKSLKVEYDRLFTILKALPIWIDLNQDKVVDDAEVSSHQHIFQRSW